MSGCRIASLLSAITLLALVASARSASATVMIKSFRFSICVASEKHPDGCKNAHADARLVVPDDQMKELDTEIGQAASIMALPNSGGTAPSHSEHHRRRFQNETAPRPGM